MWLITHAKKHCVSRKPDCDACIITKVCDKRNVDIQPKIKRGSKTMNVELVDKMGSDHP